MLPDWFAGISQGSSPYVLSLMVCLASAGEAGVGEGGQPVIRARLSCRKISRRAGIFQGSVARAVRAARARGWLVVEWGGLNNQTATYLLPLCASAPVDSALPMKRVPRGGAPPKKRVPEKRLPPGESASPEAAPQVTPYWEVHHWWSVHHRRVR